MLELGSGMQTIEGVTVFPDHADPDQYWYLPATVTLARRREDGRAQLSMIKYKPAAVAGARGGGFLMFTTALKLDEETERKVRSKLRTGTGQPRLSVVPFDEGTVRCVALNLEGSGGTVSKPAPAGGFNAVESILGATVPSLAGDNEALFSLTLSQEGVTLLEQALAEGLTPVGVIYELSFTALRPALDVKITADYGRIYEHFSAGLEASVYFLAVDIEAGFEKLVQDGAIKMEVTNFSTAADRSEKEKWAFDFFKERLLAEWFSSGLQLGSLAGEPAFAGATAPSAGAMGGGSAVPAAQPPASRPVANQPATRPVTSHPPAVSGAQGASGTGGPAPPPPPVLTQGASGTGGPPPPPPPVSAQGASGTGGPPPPPPPPASSAPVTPPVPAAVAPPPPAAIVPPPPAGGTAVPMPPPKPAQPGGVGPPAPGAPPVMPTPQAPGQPGGALPQPPGQPSGPGAPPQAGPGRQAQPPGPGQPKPGDGQPAAGGGSKASGLSVTFKLKYIRQEERKTLTFEYHSSEATKRTYAPQSLFGLLAADLERDDYFTEVDLDDPFFRHFAVDVEVPVDMAKIGLRSATVALDYGDPSEPDGHKHADLVFDRAHPDAQRWEVFVNERYEMDYAHRIELNFDPQSEWSGQRTSYELPVTRTADRTLSINPYGYIGFLEVDVFAHSIDWGAVSSIDVHLTYQAPSGWKNDKLVTLTAQTPRETWRLRTDSAEHRTYSYRLVHRLTDGTTREIEPVTTAATSIPVDDPFLGAIEPRFVFQFPAGRFQTVVIDLTYADPEAGYQREAELEIDGATLASPRVRIATIDPAKKAYGVRVTLIAPDGQIVRGPAVMTENDIVGITAAGEAT